MGSTHILEHHRGGTSPPRGFLTDESNIRIGFLGRPLIGDSPNPGSPRAGKDKAWYHKLARLFGKNCRILYIAGSHDGGINVFNPTELDQLTVIEQPVPLITALTGDAIIIDYANIPNSMRPFAAVLKVCDCGQWILKNKSRSLIALVHVSVATGVQYGNKNTQGPIIERVMQQIDGRGKVHAAMGCSINGTRDPNHRCYPWCRADALGTLSQAIHRTDPNLSQTGLFRDYPDVAKVDVNFGLLQLRLAEQVGLTLPWQLDVSQNHCTCAPEFYSMRIAQNAENDPFVSDHDKQILSVEANHRYGNLAFVYIT